MAGNDAFHFARGAFVVGDTLYTPWADGTLKAVPDSRSFVELDTGSLGLVPVRCETWAGFVFVCLDPDAPSLASYLGVVPTHLEPYGLELLG